MKRIGHWLITLLLFSLPWQTRYIFGSIAGEFTTIALYSFDIIAIVLLVLGVLNGWLVPPQKHTKLWLMLLVTGLSVSTLFSLHIDVSMYMLGRIVGAMGVGLVIVSLAYPKTWLLGIVVLNGLVETIFIVWQFFAQRVFASSWLGLAEQAPEVSGVPVIATDVGRFLRSFGTFTHPNVAAGWLILALVSIMLLWKIDRQVRYRILLLVSGCLLSFGLLLTFSRGAILVWLIMAAVGLMQQRSVFPIIFSSFAMLIIGTLIFLPLWSSRIVATQYTEAYSIAERTSQLHESRDIIQSNVLLGTGLGTYTIASTLERAQPVHNIVLLSVAEIGLVAGVLLWGGVVWLLYTAGWNTRGSSKLTVLVLTIVLLGMFDHYFWTLPSMILLFWIILAQQSKSTHAS